jgi:hypothetical protein
MIIGEDRLAAYSYHFARCHCQGLPASLAQAYAFTELEREGLIYRILANRFILGLVEKKNRLQGRSAASSATATRLC